ncbi:phosphatidic acid phosphatase type 2/haloperoxidase [Crepidotus variabilis]|uniref:Phosphatidic acid phosphatase type 2/haloperoxidase n=1 Tax=Crepidotus variabilis TaxID=179855 RepID=A0A9P6JID9_9AGAR|nr:phosphatidic acid phosphatase type 2/haloperoxidase [Crepidotus variabilis]
MVQFPFRATHPSPRGTVTNARRRRLLLSYLPDWILTIVLAAIFLSLDHIEGYRRVFSVTDTSLRHPYALHERIPSWALYIIAIIAPLVLMPIVNFLTVRSWWDLHNSQSLILAAALTGSFTQVVKITVGRPRPDLIDRCRPPAGTANPDFGLTSWTVCTQTDNGILRDGFRSFFSGHSSISFAGLGFLSFYLAGKLHLFDSRGHAGKAWLALSPFMAASLVAISRTMDYRHHWHDVLVGSLVGTVLAYFSYRMYYPSLAAPVCHRPYSPRIREEGASENGAHGSHLPMHQTEAAEYSGVRINDNDLEAAPGTVPKPDPGKLEDVWREGNAEESGGLNHGVKPPTGKHTV